MGLGRPQKLVMNMPRVYNKRHRNIPSTAVYVGRPSPFGNPFIIGQDGDRDEVCYKFEKYIENCPALIQAVKEELRGKDLICWCAPLPCHAETLIRIANED
jgi:hypothetical protein